MEEAPEVPTPPRQIPKGGLWAALLLPLTVTVAVIPAARPFFYNGHVRGLEFLAAFPAGVVMAIVGTVIFARLWRVRYGGWSLVLTTAGYFLGEVILCLAGALAGTQLSNPFTQP